MNEWAVFGVIVALIGFATAIVTPIIKLTKSITKLDLTCSSLGDDFKTISTENKSEHNKIWIKEDEQDKMLHDHDVRINLLEHK